MQQNLMQWAKSGLFKEGEKVLTVKATLPRELQSVVILPISDAHIGDPRADIKLLKERIAYIASNENAYTILCGDIFNNAVRTGVSDIYGEIASPMDAIREAVELFAPIKDKILGITDGNHEQRTYKNDGLRIGAFVAGELGLSGKYSPDALLLFLRFGELKNGKHETNGSGNLRRICYTIYATHGDGGGRKEGAKAIRLADMAAIVDADIYIHAHTHLPMIMKQGFNRVDARNSTVARVEKLFVNTGAMLNYGGYAEIKGYKAPSLHSPAIVLSGTKKHATANL